MPADGLLVGSVCLFVTSPMLDNSLLIESAELLCELQYFSFVCFRISCTSDTNVGRRPPHWACRTPDSSQQKRSVVSEAQGGPLSFRPAFGAVVVRSLC